MDDLDLHQMTNRFTAILSRLTRADRLTTILSAKALDLDGFSLVLTPDQESALRSEIASLLDEVEQAADSIEALSGKQGELDAGRLAEVMVDPVKILPQLTQVIAQGQSILSQHQPVAQPDGSYVTTFSDESAQKNADVAVTLRDGVQLVAGVIRVAADIPVAGKVAAAGEIS